MLDERLAAHGWDEDQCAGARRELFRDRHGPAGGMLRARFKCLRYQGVVFVVGMGGGSGGIGSPPLARRARYG